MSRSTKLNDLQLILLATAAQRDDGSVFPPAASIADQADRIGKTLPALLKRALIEEAPVTDQAQAWRHEDQQPIGLTITSAGRTIIAAESDGPKTSTDSDPTASSFGDSTTTIKAAPRAGSKIDTVIGLLRRDEGATLAMLVEATGWLPHTTRAALTGLRKKGHLIAKTSRDGATVYQIAQAA